MDCNTPCPDRDKLKGLLDTNIPEEEQASLIGHLDACEGCQESLEALASGDFAWADAVQPANDPPATSAFWPALQELERDDGERTTAPVGAAVAEETDDELSLDFLQPADDPSYLGRLGHFDVASVIGRGGMGLVLRAYDGCLTRPVALKVLDPRVAHSDMARQRFCREARAAASITHENVVTILQVEHEESKDLPFLVMQLVVGQSLQERLDRGGRLGLEEILRIGHQAAAGLAAAHAQGLIHRDIKPANILIEEGTGRVKLTDFGLARAAEDVKLTQTGFVAGTPLYMAPEQARGETVDHRADLFSLGSVLYALCTGRPPFQGSTPFVVLKSVTEEQPPPIREINPEVPEWLCQLIERLHAKSPADRIQSADEVADLLARQLAQLRYIESSSLVVPAPQTGQTPAVRGKGRFLALMLAPPLVFLAALLAMESTGLTRLFPSIFHRGEATPREEVVQPLFPLDAGTGPVWSLAVAPDGKNLAMALDNGTVELWNLVERSQRTRFKAHRGAVWCVAYAPDGSTLATGGSDMKVKLWDAATGQERRTLDPHGGAIRSLAFSKDGKHLVAGDRNGGVTVWDLTAFTSRQMNRGHEGEVVAVAFSPDGTTVASGGNDEMVRLWDVASGQERLALRGHHGGVYAVAFAPDGKLLASGGWDHVLHVWNAATGDERLKINGHAEDIWAVAFSPDGELIASGSEDRTLRLWDLAGNPVATFKGYTGAVYAAAFAPGGREVASGGRDGVVRLWEVPVRK